MKPCFFPRPVFFCLSPLLMCSAVISVVRPTVTFERRLVVANFPNINLLIYQQTTPVPNSLNFNLFNVTWGTAVFASVDIEYLTDSLEEDFDPIYFILNLTQSSQHQYDPVHKPPWA